MGEIRLICPGCSAEYQVSASLIPPRGREIECSACGRVWHQPGPQVAPRPARHDPITSVLTRPHPPRHEEAPAPSDQAAPPRPAPQLNRPLPPDVLSILTEEAEREREARAAEAPADMAAPPAPQAPRPQPEPDWPATTITESPLPVAGGIMEPAAVTDHSTADDSVPDPAEHGAAAPEEHAAEVIAAAGAAVSAAGSPKPDRSAARPDYPPHIEPKPAAAPREAAGGGRGFVLGLLIAALVLAAYLAAPLAPADTGWGAMVSEWRDMADAARLWLAGLF